jgi:spermidine/putrescine transport system substrate-binding protein
MTGQMKTRSSPAIEPSTDRRAGVRAVAAAAGTAFALAATLVLGGAVAAQDQPDINGTTIDIISLDGEDGQTELEAWRAERDITLAKVPFSSWDETFAKLKTDVFDIALVANPYVSLWGQAGVLQPLDLSRLTNWNDLYPALREGSFIRDDAGNVYAVPIAWGDGPYIYSPDRVDTPPTSIMELMDPSWAGRIVTFDDPILIFYMVAAAKGYEPPNLTLEQLADVKTDAKVIVDNLVAFSAGYEDATDLLVRGEADLAIGGWEAMLNWAQEKGATLDFGFFDEANGGGWADSLAIPTNAEDVDAAYAYIDAMISPEVNAEVATNLISGATNSLATPMVDPSALIYDYSIVENMDNPIQFVDWTPPLEADAGYATKADWDAAWSEIRAGL